MTIALCVICGIALSLVLVTGLRLLNTFRPGLNETEAETGLNRSLDFYQPMERLLAEDDFRFLHGQQGVSARSIRQMRAERRRIFRKYLQALATDFSILTNNLRTIMVHSPESREDLATAMLSARIIFSAAMVGIELRLMLNSLGFHGLPVSALDLTEGLAQMRRELEHFAPAQMLAIF